MIIDFHTHAYAPEVAGRVMPRLKANLNGRPVYHDGTIAGLKGALLEVGAGLGVQLNTAGSPKSERMINDFAMEVDRAEEGLIAFGSVHPESGAYHEELLRLKEAGIAGIKFHPHFQRMNIDAPECMRAYEACLRLGFIVLIHGGNDISFPGAENASPERCVNVAKALPGERLVIAHFGVNDAWQEMPEALILSDVYFDTSLVFKFDPARAAEVFKAHGTKKILFGTDLPFRSATQHIEYINALDLSKEEKENVFYRSAAKLLSESGGTAPEKIKKALARQEKV